MSILKIDVKHIQIRFYWKMCLLYKIIKKINKLMLSFIIIKYLLILNV